jgi:ankyrin repeat protein
MRFVEEMAYVPITNSSIQMSQIYTSEMQARFNTAKAIANIIVRHNDGQQAVKPTKSDDKNLKELRQMLEVDYIQLYRIILQCIAKLICSLHRELFFKLVSNIVKLDNWAGELNNLRDADDQCDKDRDAIERREAKIARDKRTPSPSPSRNGGFGNTKRTPLHQAATLNLPDKVFDLVSAGEYDVNALSPRKWTALMMAAEIGATKVAKTLLAAKGVKTDIQNMEGRTALHIAAANNHVGVVKLLLSHKAKLDIRDNKGWTAFLYAARNGHADVLKALKEKKQDMNETTTKSGWTGLHLAAEMGRVNAVKFLVQNGAKKWIKVKKGDSIGLTAKEIAEKNDKKKVLEFL